MKSIRGLNGTLLALPLIATASLTPCTAVATPALAVQDSVEEDPAAPTHAEEKSTANEDHAAPSTQSISQARAAIPRRKSRWMNNITFRYPREARLEGDRAIVVVRVSVAPRGRATDCEVIHSSGSEVLDQAACDGMETYSRFKPALDEAGNPTTGEYYTRLTYDVPRPQRPPPAPKEPSEHTKRYEAEVKESQELQARQRGGTPEYEAALAWLREADAGTYAATGGGSGVMVRGFVDKRQFPDNLIEHVGQGSLKPNLILSDPLEADREPIRVVHSRLQSGVPDYCVLLVQVQRLRDGQGLSDHQSAMADGAAFWTDGYAVDETCKRTRPWWDGAEMGDTFDWNGEAMLVGRDGFVRSAPEHSCEGVGDLSIGTFTFSTAFPIFKTQYVRNAPIELYRENLVALDKSGHLGGIASWFSQGASEAEQSDIREIKIVYDPRIKGGAKDVSATFSILNNEIANAKCVIVRLEQNGSLFQRSATIPNDHWSRKDFWAELSAISKGMGAEFQEFAVVEPMKTADVAQ